MDEPLFHVITIMRPWIQQRTVLCSLLDYYTILLVQFIRRSLRWHDLLHYILIIHLFHCILHDYKIVIIDSTFNYKFDHMKYVLEWFKLLA